MRRGPGQRQHYGPLPATGESIIPGQWGWEIIRHRSVSAVAGGLLERDENTTAGSSFSLALAGLGPMGDPARKGSNLSRLGLSQWQLWSDATGNYRNQASGASEPLNESGTFG